MDCAPVDCFARSRGLINLPINLLQKLRRKKVPLQFILPFAQSDVIGWVLVGCSTVVDCIRREQPMDGVWVMWNPAHNAMATAAAPIKV